MDRSRVVGDAIEGTREGPPEPAPIATVVVVAWNGERLLPACLDSLAKQNLDGEFVTWVVDNASADATSAVAERHPASSRIIRSRRNIGFAGAVDLALREAETPFLVVLNQDATLEPGCLAALIEPLRDSPDIAAVTSKVLLAADGRLNNAGVLVGPDGYGRDRGFGEPDDGRYRAAEDVPAFSGTAAALRVSAALEVGSFDPDFFLYYEDTDLSWRLRLSGWRVVYAPDAVVRHEHAASSDIRSAAFAFYNERNRLWMLAKCAPISLVLKELLRFAAITVLLPLRRARGVRIPPGRQFRTALRLRVLASSVMQAPSLARKRRAITRTARRSRAEVYRELASASVRLGATPEAGSRA